MQTTSPKSHLKFELQVNFNSPWSWVKTEARVIPQRTIYIDFTEKFCTFCIEMSLVFKEFTLWQIMKPPSQGLHYQRTEGCVGSLLLWAPKTAGWRQYRRASESQSPGSLSLAWENNEALWFNAPRAGLQQTQTHKSKKWWTVSMGPFFIFSS